jgi:hypothetical protein
VLQYVKCHRLLPIHMAFTTHPSTPANPERHFPHSETQTPPSPHLAQPRPHPTPDRIYLLAQHWGLHGRERGVLTRRGFDDLKHAGFKSRGEHGEGVATRPELNLCSEHGEVVMTSTECARRKGARAAKGGARRKKGCAPQCLTEVSAPP